MDALEIKELNSIIYSIIKDEFEDKIVLGENFLDLKKNLLYLLTRIDSKKERINLLISHILDQCSADDFKSISLSEYDDEIDVIIMGFNSFAEEIRDKTINRDFFFQVISLLSQKIFVFDIEGNLDFINFLGKEIFEHRKSKVDLKIYEFLPIELVNKINSFIESKKDNEKFELLINNETYSITQLSCSIARIDQIKKNHFLLVVDDVSVKKEEEKKILKATLVGQDIERKRLAHDLHDSLGQELNAIKMYLNSVDLMDVNSDIYKQTMGDVHEMLNQSIKSIRDISFDLMPVILDSTELSLSISQLINRLDQICEIEFEVCFSTETITLSDKKEELFIYRIVQEFLNNSMKYSKATKISLFFNQNGKDLEVCLMDNGIGFDFENVTRRSGISNITQRLVSLNAKYVYESSIGNGTKLNFKFHG
jgi:signal transduction histidine kinase